jgi:hypothetical protein
VERGFGSGRSPSVPASGGWSCLRPCRPRSPTSPIVVSSIVGTGVGSPDLLTLGWSTLARLFPRLSSPR